jgi:hypothetical protein
LGSTENGRNRIPKRMLLVYMNLETTRLKGRPKEDGRIMSGEGWQEEVYNREECQKLLRTATNRRILYMPME